MVGRTGPELQGGAHGVLHYERESMSEHQEEEGDEKRGPATMTQIERSLVIRYHHILLRNLATGGHGEVEGRGERK